MGDEARIWIGGLPDGISEKAIREEYDKYGSIKHIQIRCNRGSPSFAFVQYSDRGDAEDAVRATDQCKLFGMPFVKVSWAGKGAPRGGGKGKGKGKGKRSRSRGRRSRSRSKRSSPSRRADSRRRSRSAPPRRQSRSRSPPTRKDSNERSEPRNGSRRRSPSYQQGRRGSRSRDAEPAPAAGRSRSGDGGRGRSASGGRRPAWFQPKPSEVQGKYRMKIERLPEDMGWQELKGLGAKLAKVGSCTFSRTNRDRTGILEFTSLEDMENAIRELDGRRFSGSEERVKAYEERNSHR